MKPILVNSCRLILKPNSSKYINTVPRLIISKPKLQQPLPDTAYSNLSERGYVDGYFAHDLAPITADASI